MITLILAGLLTGCEVKIYDDTGWSNTDDTSSTTDDSGDTTGGTDSGGEVNTTDPEVAHGTIQCQSGDSHDPYNLYYVDVDVLDPQGSSDIATIGNKVYAYDESGSLIFSDDILVCTGGTCVGSFREDGYDALDCDEISNQKFTVEIFDNDENSSGEVKLTALVPEA